MFAFLRSIYRKCNRPSPEFLQAVAPVVPPLLLAEGINLAEFLEAWVLEPTYLIEPWTAILSRRMEWQRTSVERKQDMAVLCACDL